ncbi:HTH_Tnp_Tc3_2 domain-containing protein [Trichonephila clavipes]|nr:HTH_Tnp_Tc3_2 domain-containing protein [Trichonephila clavipes]
MKVVMPRVRSINAYQYISDFDNGRIVADRDCGLSYRCISVRVGRDAMIVNRKSNQWIQDGNTERHAGYQRPPIISRREDRYVTRMVLMDGATMSRVLRQELESFARQVSPQTVRRLW